jgi:hypothetical protein
LKEHDIEAVANIELTRGKDGAPNNTVHFHVLMDDQRSEQELHDLFNTACERGGLNREDFRIDYRPLWNGDWYFRYFTKYGYSDRVILFRQGTGIQKFYQIGKWFTKSKRQIWEDIKAYMREKYGTHPDKADELPCELIGEDLDAEPGSVIAEKPMAINGGVNRTSYCCFLTSHIRNWRYEWRRYFSYSIAFLQ